MLMPEPPFERLYLAADVDLPGDGGQGQGKKRLRAELPPTDFRGTTAWSPDAWRRS
jgi:hypothetical protein